MDKNIDKNLAKRTKSLTRRALVFLYWEKYAAIFAVPSLALLVFLALAGFGLWQRIGDPLRLIALISVLFLFWRAALKARKIPKPTISQAKRRVEFDNGLAHRPLDVITDNIALGANSDSACNNPAWTNFKQNAARKLQNARPPKPRPVLGLIDKYKLRFIVPVFLVLGLMVGFGDNYERLRFSVLPIWQYGMSGKNVQYEAWIVPPEYTSRPPSYFKNKSEMSIPAGSEFFVRISGVRQPPRLVLKSANKTRRLAAKKLGPKSFETSAVIDKPAAAYFRIGSNEKKYRLNTLPDRAPKINFDELPKADKRDRLIFSYSLDDDYGVRKIILSVSPVLSPDETDEITITGPGFSLRQAEKEPGSINLTKHKWAGEKVKGRLLAVDGKGQIGLSKTAEFIIPDKVFVEPLAKAIAEQRRLVLKGNRPYRKTPVKPAIIDDNSDKPLFAVDRPDLAIERAPEEIKRASILIDAITDRPAGLYQDPAVYMGLRNVYRRLRLARAQTDLAGIDEDLWAIAIRAEFGRLGDALEDMRRAQRALNNAMARHAPQREIDVLFERYNAAVDRYIEQLTLEAVKKARQMADGQDGNMEGRSVDQIQELLDAIEEANRMGDTVAARKALAKLAELLENMQIQMAQGQGGEGSSLGEGMSEELRQALEELNDALGEERKLRDETRDTMRKDADSWAGQSQDSQNDEQGENKTAKSAEELARRQREIAKMVDELAKDLSQVQTNAGKEKDKSDDGSGSKKGGKEAIGDEGIKKALRQAQDAMKKAAEELENSEFYAAGEAQSDAIEALRKAGEGLLEQEAERLAEENKNNGKAAKGDDPFGREGGSGVGESDIKVPEKSDRQRARELLELLRQRAGESERNRIEREYLERLLERF